MLGQPARNIIGSATAVVARKSRRVSIHRGRWLIAPTYLRFFPNLITPWQRFGSVRRDTVWIGRAGMPYLWAERTSCLLLTSGATST